MKNWVLHGLYMKNLQERKGMYKLLSRKGHFKNYLYQLAQRKNCHVNNWLPCAWDKPMTAKQLSRVVKISKSIRKRAR